MAIYVSMSSQGPWSLGNLNLVEYFSPGSQAFEVNSWTLFAFCWGQISLQNGERSSLSFGSHDAHLRQSILIIVSMKSFHPQTRQLIADHSWLQN